MYVDPSHLRGYAGQLKELETGTFPAMRKHCLKHCTGAKGWDGLLAVLKDFEHYVGTTIADLMKQCEKGSGKLREGLDTTADNYWRTDTEHAISLGSTPTSYGCVPDTTGPRTSETGPADVSVDNGSGTTTTDHIDTRDIANRSITDVAAGYSAGTAISYDVPKPNHDFVDWVAGELEDMFGGMIKSVLGAGSSVAEVAQEVTAEVGSWFDDDDGGKSRSDDPDISSAINDLIKWFTGYDLYGKLAHATVGDPSVVRSMGKAWGNLEAGFLAVAKDIEDGVSTLDDNWDSEPGGVSEQFCDQTIRQKWIPAFEAMSDFCHMGEQHAEGVAMMYEHLIRNLIGIAHVFLSKITKGLNAFDPTVKKTREDPAGALSELIELVKGLWEVIQDIYGTIERQCEIAIENLDMLCAEITVFYDEFSGDLDVLATV